MSQVILSTNIGLNTEYQALSSQQSEDNTSRNIEKNEVNGINFANRVKEVSNNSEKIKEKEDSIFERIKENLEKLNEFIPLQSTNLIFEFDEIGDPPIIKVIDKDSSEVIREIPPQEFNEIAKVLDEFADRLNRSGILFNETV